MIQQDHTPQTAIEARRLPDAGMDEDTGRAILNQWTGPDGTTGPLPGALGVAATVLVDTAEALEMGEVSLLPAGGNMAAIQLLAACERALSCIRRTLEVETADDATLAGGGS